MLMRGVYVGDVITTNRRAKNMVIIDFQNIVKIIRAGIYGKVYKNAFDHKKASNIPWCLVKNRKMVGAS